MDDSFQIVFNFCFLWGFASRKLKRTSGHN